MYLSGILCWPVHTHVCDGVKTSCTSTRRSATSHDACSGVSYHSPCMVHLGSPPGTWHDDSSTQHRVHKAIHHMSVHSDTNHMQAVGWMQKGGFTTLSTSARWPLLNKQQIVKKCLRGLTKPTVVAATRQDSDRRESERWCRPNCVRTVGRSTA